LSQLIYSTMARRFDPFRRLAARVVRVTPDNDRAKQPA
jgi:hypothetical protein